MRFLMRLGALLCFVLLCASGTRLVAAPAPLTEKHYVCPPCDQDCDTKVYDNPGDCPTCGMRLIDSDSEAAHPHRRKVAILVFNSVEIIDFTGPYEMFGAAGFEVYTVAATKEAVTSSMGLTVVPKYTFTDAPQPDVLVIPGGGVGEASADAPTLRYIKEATAHTQNTMSVCNGAFILASTGMLDGLKATTTRGNLPRLTSQFPSVKVIGDQRYTDNGKIITTGGLSAGIDGALHVIEKLLGAVAAREVAVVEEYNWQPGTKLPSSITAHKVNLRKVSATAAVYVCPMKEHPKESTKPGKCEICKMDLVTKKN